MFYGIIGATATINCYNNKLKVVTKGFENEIDAKSALDEKIKALPRQIKHRSVLPLGDTAVAKIPGGEIIIPDGYFGIVVHLF